METLAQISLTHSFPFILRQYMTRLINLSIDLKDQRQVMNRICSKQSVKTPFFDNKHSKSTSYFPQEAFILDFVEDSKKMQKEHMKYRNIHKKFSENKINTLDDILAKTLNDIQEAKSHQKSTKPFKKVPTASALHTKLLNNQLKSHSKSIKSFKSSIHTFSSQQKHQECLVKKKRTINGHQAQKVTRILNNICNKSVRSKFQQKGRHSITDWIKLVHEIEENSKNQLHLTPMVNQSKLVLWTESKIVKTAENIYQQITKTGHKAYSNEKREDLFDKFQQISIIIKGFFFKKYKTDKLMKETLTNLIYSLQHHISKLEKNWHSIIQLGRYNYLRLFQDILDQNYETQDVLFCLFSRKIIKELYQDRENMYISLDEKRSRYFFMVISENDQELIQQYELNMNEYFKIRKELDLYEFLALITKDYKQKRVKRKAKVSQNKDIKHQNKYHQRVSNQLSSINYEYDQHFWILEAQSYPNQLLQLKNEILYQAKRLINMLCNTLSIEYKTFIKELVVVKSMQIVLISQKFNKKGILEQLGLYQRLIGQQSKIIYLKSLQQLRNEAFLVFNSLKNKPNDPKIIQKFVKKLLTTPLLANKLYEIIQYFEILKYKQQ